MIQPLRHEIEKLATKAFAVAHERISVQGAEKKRQTLIEVAQRGNIGGYLPALTECAAERVREAILALADAYVDAFTLAETPADANFEKTLETSSLQIAGGAISGVRGELDLISKRTQMPLDRGAGHIEREIRKSRVSALNEAQLKLEQHQMAMNIMASRTVRTGEESVTTRPPLPSAEPPTPPRHKACSDNTGAAVERRNFIAPFLQKETLSGMATRSAAKRA